jgi:hypothetical protein
MSYGRDSAARCASAGELSTTSGRSVTRATSVLVFAAILPLMAGCAIHPLPDDVTRETTHSIVQKIRCEAKRGILDHGRRLGDDTTLAYEFEFNINERNDAQAGFTLTNPFKRGTFALTTGAGVERMRDAARNFRLVDSFGERRRADCRPEILEKNWMYPIAGDIGMYEAVATFAKLHQVENPELGGDMFSFADTLSFTTTLSSDVNATLSVAPVSQRLWLTAANAGLETHARITTSSSSR